MDGWLARLTEAAWVQCWQVTLLIAIFWLIVRFTSRNRPHLASVLWIVVLLKCVTPPVWSSPSGIFCWLQTGKTPPPPTAAASNEFHFPAIENEFFRPNTDDVAA